MKKVIAILLGVTVAGTIAVAQSVPSRNAVGYVKVELVGSNLELVGMPFEQVDKTLTNTTATIVGDQLPGGSNVYIWDKGTSTYNIETFGRGGWPATTEINRGDAFWVQAPGLAGETNVLYLMGEVPDSMNGGATTTVTAVELDAISYAYPVAIDWVNTTLAAGAVGGEDAYFWNGSGYDISTLGRGGWSGVGATKTIEPGEAFWYSSKIAGGVNWEEVKPYTYPE